MEKPKITKDDVMMFVKDTYKKSEKMPDGTISNSVRSVLLDEIYSFRKKHSGCRYYRQIVLFFFEQEIELENKNLESISASIKNMREDVAHYLPCDIEEMVTKMHHVLLRIFSLQGILRCLNHLFLQKRLFR